jgi:hypothetical protein
MEIAKIKISLLIIIETRCAFLDPRRWRRLASTLRQPDRCEADRDATHRDHLPHCATSIS